MKLTRPFTFRGGLCLSVTLVKTCRGSRSFTSLLNLGHSGYGVIVMKVLPFLIPDKMNQQFEPTGGHRTSHRSPTSGHRGGHDTFCGFLGWTTGGRKFSCCIQNIAKIVTRTCINFVDTPAFTTALSAFVICLFCLSYICFSALPTSHS